MRLLVLCLLVAVLASGPQSNDGTYSDDHLDNNFGGDGSIQVGFQGKHDWIRLKWQSLTEVAANGSVILPEDLTNHQFGWSGVADRDVDGDHGSKFPGVNFSEPLSNGAWFNVSVWMVNTTVTIGNVTAPSHSVKFNVYIGNWTFQDAANTLQLTAHLDGSGTYRGEVRETLKDGQAAVNGTDDNDFKTKSVAYGPGFLSSPNMAACDGVTCTVNVSIGLYGAPVVTWSFPSFTNNVTYDPILGSGAKAVPSFFLLALLVLFCFGGKQ